MTMTMAVTKTMAMTTSVDDNDNDKDNDNDNYCDSDRTLGFCLCQSFLSPSSFKRAFSELLP